MPIVSWNPDDLLEWIPYRPGEFLMYPRPFIAFRLDSDQHFVFRFVDIHYWPGYGFVVPELATTNGNFAFLKACVPEYYRPYLTEFYDFVLSLGGCGANHLEY